MKKFQLFSSDLGVDLGTANVLIYVDGKGVVVREPSVVAVDKNTGKILQVGSDARNMLGRTPGNVVAMRPLKGGVISIAIGAVLYLFVVRIVFLRKNADGTDRYVDLWPKKLDLEDLLYRPLLQTILPFAGVFVCRICDSLVDGLIVFLRKTIYKDRKIPFRTGRLPDVGAVIGTMLDRTAARRGGRSENTVYRVRMRHIKWLTDESLGMIRRSLSYGLQLAGVGLVLILLYLLI